MDASLPSVFGGFLDLRDSKGEDERSKTSFRMCFPRPPLLTGRCKCTKFSGCAKRCAPVFLPTPGNGQAESMCEKSGHFPPTVHALSRPQRRPDGDTGHTEQPAEPHGVSTAGNLLKHIPLTDSGGRLCSRSAMPWQKIATPWQSFAKAWQKSRMPLRKRGRRT